MYRLSASASGSGWTAHLKNALATAKFGETVQVPVYVDKAADASASGSVTLTATSESDPSKAMSVSCSTTDGTVGGTVPATLALTLGTAANFGAFTPGAQRDYYATTTANVTSTAGDATLSVADPAPHPGHLVNGAFALPEALQVSGARTRRQPTRRSVARRTRLVSCTAPIPTTTSASASSSRSRPTTRCVRVRTPSR